MAIAVMVVPALWRRAGQHERKRIEASMPLSREELEAQIGAVRAEYAMALRRLEIKSDAAKQKAAQDFVAINLLKEEIHSLKMKLEETEEALVDATDERDELAAQLSSAEKENREQQAKLESIEESLAETTREVEQISRLYEEASLTSSSRQIELVARETEIDHLKETIASLRSQRKEVDRALREATSEKTKIEKALEVERKKAATLERKLERLMTELSTRENRIERQEAEIKRLKEKAKGGAKGETAGKARQASRKPVEPAVKATSQTSVSLALEEGGSATALGLDSQFSEVLKQSEKLQAELRESASETGDMDEELFRERISNLAAEVVNLVAGMDGPESPIEKALSQSSLDPEDDRDPPASLADRVRLLRQTSNSSEKDVTEQSKGDRSG